MQLNLLCQFTPPDKLNDLWPLYTYSKLLRMEPIPSLCFLGFVELADGVDRLNKLDVLTSPSLTIRVTLTKLRILENGC